MELRTEVTASGDVVVYPSGALDLQSTPQLRDALSALLGDGRKRILVNLTDVELMDSTALGSLLSAMKTARKHGGDLRITGANQRVQTLLTLTKLSDVLKEAGPDGEVSS